MNKLLLFPDIDTSPSLTATPACSCHEFIWEEGRFLAADEYDFSNLEYICESLPGGTMTDFAATDMGAPVVSPKLKQLFDSLGLQLQYFPLRIIEKEGAAPRTDFHIVNIVGMVDCIDYDASDLEVEEEDGEIVDIIDVGTLVLKQESFGDIYRMYMYERVIVVEGTLASKLQELGISGMKLIEPEKWDGIASVKDDA